MRKLFWMLACLGMAVSPRSAEGGSGGSATAAFDRAMHPIVTEYLKIQRALAADEMTGVKAAARAIAQAAAKLGKVKVTGEHAEHYRGIPDKLAKAAASLASAESLDTARERMKALSRPTALWATLSKPKDLDVVFCSMAKGSWVQRPGPIRNPYYGASMLECGEIVQAHDDKKAR